MLKEIRVKSILNKHKKRDDWFLDDYSVYYKALEKHFPELVPKYRSLFRIFFAPPKEYQKELEEKSKRLCSRYGIGYGII